MSNRIRSWRYCGRWAWTMRKGAASIAPSRWKTCAAKPDGGSTAARSTVYAETSIDDGLHQGSAVNPGGIVGHPRLTRRQRDVCALHARQGRQHPGDAVDAAAARHAGYG